MTKKLHELPTIDDPTPDRRARARAYFGSGAVPDEGPCPDPFHAHTPEVEIEVPQWALTAVRNRLALADDPDREKAYGLLFDHVQPDITFTHDGRDAVDVVLADQPVDE